MEKKWILSKPTFESDSINPKLRFAYWVGHRYFIYDLLKFMKPRTIIELGSQYGCSLFAILQSIKDNNIICEINAVDMWSGDIGAEHDGETVYKMVNEIKDKLFSNLNVNLYQMRFDNAINNFEDEYFDLIHIDGSHDYSDVKYDFEIWLPKLKKNGVILFHDVFSTLEEGACIFWSELKEIYSDYFEFKHSCGLGILFPKGNDLFLEMIKVGFFDFYKDIYIYKSEYEYIKERFLELEDLYVRRYDIITKQDTMIKDRDEVIKLNEKMIKDRDEVIKLNEKMIKDRDEVIKSNEKMIKDRDEVIKLNEKMIKDRDEVIKLNEKMIKDRDEVIKLNEKMIKDRDEVIKLNEEMIKDRDEVIKSNEKMIKDKDKELNHFKNRKIIINVNNKQRGNI